MELILIGFVRHRAMERRYTAVFIPSALLFFSILGLVEITIDSPLSCVQSVLGMLGVDV
jgi:vacuolar-type H+-ATPase subunit I/STV1